MKKKSNFNLNKVVNNFKRDAYSKESMKICLFYFLAGAVWILFSDNIAHFLLRNSDVTRVIDTYKGVVYVTITAIILYGLMARLFRKVRFTEEKLQESNEEMTAVNEELQAYVQQITASEEEVRCQYEEILEYDAKLRVSEERYKSLIFEMQLGYMLFEGSEEGNLSEYVLIDVNNSYELYSEETREDSIGRHFFELLAFVGSDTFEQVRQVIKTGDTLRYKAYREDLGRYFESIAFRPQRNQLAILFNDITERVAAEEKMSHLIHHDQLTSLHNRRYFEEICSKMDVADNYPLMHVILDVNGLKLINDSFGHASGDEYLQKVAEVLRKICREEDEVCRFSGDEFFIFMPKMNETMAHEKMKEIRMEMKQYSIHSIPLSITAGYYEKTDTHVTFKEAFKKAEDDMYKKKLRDTKVRKEKTISTIMTGLHETYPREEQHSVRVSYLCEQMGIGMGMDEEDVLELKTVGILHDIGKIAIEEDILNKPARVNEEEWKEIQKHPVIGYRILTSTPEHAGIAEYVLAHHERWDGSGYPKGLKGEEIPLQSRIISIADAYDAMISDRSYRKAQTKEYAVNELMKCAGTQFCPYCVNVFLEKVVGEIDLG